jgi:membrane-associated phospholipid phosphatase
MTKDPLRAPELAKGNIPSNIQFNGFMVILMAALAAFDLLLAHRVQLFGFGTLLEAIPSLLVLFGVLCYCIGRPLPKLVGFCEVTFYGVLLYGVLGALALGTGRVPGALKDAQLAAVDRFFHFQTAEVVHLVDRFPALNHAMTLIYASLAVFAVLAIFVPVFAGQRATPRKLVLRVTFAGLATAALFAVVPAAGPWTTEDIRPSREQAQISDCLTRMKAPGAMDIATANGGIVAFPSFHVILAVLSACALGSVRFLRIPSWILCTLICISTMTTGWHYGIDVLGGIVVAIAAIAVSNRLFAALASMPIPASKPH